MTILRFKALLPAINRVGLVRIRIANLKEFKGVF